jgi:hypothetical protein
LLAARDSCSYDASLALEASKALQAAIEALVQERDVLKAHASLRIEEVGAGRQHDCQCNTHKETIMIKTLVRDLFGRAAPDALQPYLRVLDCSDILELADMYGEARELGDTKLTAAINDRMGQVMRAQGLVPTQGNNHE